MFVADVCKAGKCVCGSTGTAACLPGQQCIGNSCQCNPTSCPTGCCAGNACQTPDVNNCGTAGAQCMPCDLRSDTCTTGGQCVCGTTGGACPSGQECVGGACTCDATSCPNGCCDGSNNCHSPGNFITCGKFGSLCVGCSSISADQCNINGQCSCGPTAGVCPAGAQCNSSQCFCGGSTTPITSDPNNCGTCGNVCPAGSTCQNGSCFFAFAPCTTPASYTTGSLNITFPNGNFTYRPSCLKVAVGATVNFIANGGAVFANHPREPSTIRVSPGVPNPITLDNSNNTSDMVTFTQPGFFGFYCGIHGSNAGNVGTMNGVVWVQ
jgi:plastocyanin